MANDPAFPDHPFWDFSLSIYRGAVPGACLALQEGLGVDVNVLLYALWRGKHVPEVLPQAAMQDFLTAVAIWHQGVVQPLRRARRAARVAPDGLDATLIKSLHDRILQVEIASEHAEQLLIATLGDRHFGPVDASIAVGDDDARQTSAGNLQAYFEAAGVGLDAAATSAVDVLLSQAFEPKVGSAPRA